jgi:tRNA-specific adenosine deaminase 2
MLPHNDLMQEALCEARKALESGEVPVGCVIVDEGQKIVARGYNQTNVTNDATRHCEFVSIENLIAEKKFIDWSTCTLYVTVEPCVMCAAALRIIGLTNVVYGCGNDRFGGCSSVLDVHEIDADHLPVLKVIPGVMKDDAIKLLQQFYERGNEKLPVVKRHRRGEVSDSIS